MKYPHHIKKVFFSGAAALLLFGACKPTKVAMVGQLNMISARNVDSKTNYELLRYYTGGGEAELKKSRWTSVDQAINESVKNVPGGEFMKNVRIYKISVKDKSYWAAEGDVWGIDLPDLDVNGFKVGERVFYRPKKNKSREATIIAIKNASLYLIELKQTGRRVEVAPGELYKTQSDADAGGTI